MFKFFKAVLYFVPEWKNLSKLRQLSIKNVLMYLKTLIKNAKISQTHTSTLLIASKE